MSKSSKAVSLLVALFVLLGAFTTPAFAGDKATNMVLIASYYVPNKGPVFEFQVNGDVVGINNASLVTSEKTFNNVGCTQIDAETVKCTTPKKSAGLNGTLHIGSFIFWVSVPKARTMGYGVYDWDVNGNWSQIGTYYQDGPRPAWIQFYNPDWGETFQYVYLPNGLDCYNAGPGYYYPWCPGD